MMMMLLSWLLASCGTTKTTTDGCEWVNIVSPDKAEIPILTRETIDQINELYCKKKMICDGVVPELCKKIISRWKYRSNISE